MFAYMAGLKVVIKRDQGSLFWQLKKGKKQSGEKAKPQGYQLEI